MLDKDKLMSAVVSLFRHLPQLKDRVVLIGGAAAMLRLEYAKESDRIRPTIDIDLVQIKAVELEMLEKIIPGIPIDLILMADSEGNTGLLSNDAFRIVLADIDLLDFRGVVIPIVGPIGLLASKLCRSGEHGMEYARGKDLADIIHVWISQPGLVIDRFSQLRDMPGVKDAVKELKRLMRNDYSKGTKAVLEELYLEPGDMEFMLLKARLDSLLSELPKD